jgi:hypothetical protein
VLENSVIKKHKDEQVTFEISPAGFSIVSSLTNIRCEVPVKWSQQEAGTIRAPDVFSLSRPRSRWEGYEVPSLERLELAGTVGNWAD